MESLQVNLVEDINTTHDPIGKSGEELRSENNEVAMNIFPGNIQRIKC